MITDPRRLECSGHRRVGFGFWRYMYTDEQLEAIQWFKGPMLVLGTPGSGKTTVIVNRINNLIYEHGVNPRNILVITFTRAAAASMKERFLQLSDLKKTEVRFGTFHSFFYWIIRTAYGNNLSVLEEQPKKDVIRGILRKIDKENYDNEETVISVMNQMGRISSDMIDIENYYSRDMSDDDFKKVYRLFSDYKSSKGLIDYDDMVTECYKLLKSRKDILDKLRAMYPYIMIDEFQDTNLIQYEIIKMLAHPRDNIYAVGDDDQSIYGFRGARPDIMLYFSKEFKNTKILSLTNNFRCPAKIVDLSQDVISSNKKRYDKVLRSAVDTTGSIYVIKIPEKSVEARSVISRIQKAHDEGVPYDEMAVLFRTNLGPGNLIYELQQYGIPFSVRDTIPDIFSNPVVRPVIAYISFATGENTRENLLRFMNKPVRYISRDMLDTEKVDMNRLLSKAGDREYLRKNINRLISELRTIGGLKPYVAVNYIRSAVGYENSLKTLAEEKGIDFDEMIGPLNEFQNMLKDIPSYDKMFDMIAETKELYKKLEETQEADISNKVQLMTLHSVKGLEFKEVHILDLYDGNIPHKKSRSDLEIEEERRMLYVGITRSSDNLYMYVPNEVNDSKVKPSRFIKGLIKK